MAVIPMEWIDKIFHCMELFYGERWSAYFEKPHIEAFYKTIWRSGLCDLTHEQIKNALKLCKRSALNQAIKPPHVMEFYQYATGTSQPYIDYHPKAIVEKKRDPEIQRQAMSDIRSKLGMGARLEVYGRLGR